MSSDAIYVTFGNNVAFMGNNKNGGAGGIFKTSVECKLVISY